MNKNKEEALITYIDMIEKSWTYARLTEDEIEQLMKSINWANEQGYIKGSFNQRWGILQTIYTTFLNALNYNPLTWRE